MKRLRKSQRMNSFVFSTGFIGIVKLLMLEDERKADNTLSGTHCTHFMNTIVISFNRLQRIDKTVHEQKNMLKQIITFSQKKV